MKSLCHVVGGPRPRPSSGRPESRAVGASRSFPGAPAGPSVPAEAPLSLTALRGIRQSLRGLTRVHSKHRRLESAPTEVRRVFVAVSFPGLLCESTWPIILPLSLRKLTPLIYGPHSAILGNNLRLELLRSRLQINVVPLVRTSVCLFPGPIP